MLPPSRQACHGVRHARGARVLPQLLVRTSWAKVSPERTLFTGQLANTAAMTAYMAWLITDRPRQSRLQQLQRCLLLLVLT